MAAALHMASSASATSSLRHASTLLLCRPRLDAVANGAEDFEILMVQRAAKSRFMARAYVFPGGVVEASDAELSPSLCAQEELAWRLDADDRRHRVAAIRETLEETGLLLAQHAPLVPDSAWRSAVAQTPTELAALCTRTGARLRVGELRPFAHWVTPKEERWRYDTRFYLAVLAQSESRAAAAVSSDSSETRTAVWTAPSAALAAFAEQRWSLPPPTWHALKQLSALRTLAHVERRYARVPSDDPERWLPSLRSIDGQMCVILPGDALHEDTADARADLSGSNSDARHRIVLRGAHDYVLERRGLDD